jgi:hypothetical protein
MSDSAIYDAVRRRTKRAFGFGVNLHWFRYAAGILVNTGSGQRERGQRSPGARVI